MDIKTILFAINSSEAGLHAVQNATWLASCAAGTLFIVHVSDREPYPVGEAFCDVPEADPNGLDELKAIVPDDATAPREHPLLYGEPGAVEVTQPAKVIVDFANKENVDMIVLGTHGRSGFRHMVLGSVAESVVRHARCPVVAVRQSKESQRTSDR